MGRVYGEPVEVQARDDGRPVRFVWRGRLYSVRAVVEHWVINREWWREQNPDPEAPEREYWRVEASPGQGVPAGVYELRHEIATDDWSLRRVLDLRVPVTQRADLRTARELGTLTTNLASDFVHLHVASSYSLRYGVASPVTMAPRAAELGMPALALTDRDGLYGAFKHAQACAEAEIKAVLGADLTLGAGSRGWGSAGDGSERSVGGGSQPAERVTVLATGRRGWTSLCRLVSAAHAVGGRGTPVVTPDLIAAHAEGLIVLLGPGSDVGQAIAARRPDRGAAALDRWRDRCEIAVEIVDHRGPGDTHRAGRMLRLAREAGVPAVLTNAVRYLMPADGPVAQVLDAARQLVPLGSPRLADHNGQEYLASGAEMAVTASRVCGSGSGSGLGRSELAAELLRATAALAQRCYLDPGHDLGIGGRHLPETGGGDPLGLLRASCEDGLLRRWPGTGSPGRSGAVTARRVRVTRNRLDHELNIIARTGLASYFLTVADVARRIRERGIRCAIRGSGAGSLVNHLIGISAIDPLEHDLIMERFLSEGRVGLPDIDLDVESARRIEAYRVILDAYGEERCACVSMMETYRARSAIRDVAAALGLPRDEIDAVAKAFPHIRARHIGSALTELPELRGSRLSIPQLASVFRIAERLDGLPRHVAMHPCGVVLSNATLLDRTSVERSLDDLPLSQLDKDDVETAGMIKLDVLGVRMQSAMARTLDEIERVRGERVDIDTVPRNDEPTFEMIRAAQTLGCFQIESPGQRELVVKLAPRNIGDLIVDISLFRPGPVNSDMVTPFLEIRHGARRPCFPDEKLAAVLSETGGVVIFHEQVLRIIHAMTGCGLSDAELVRRRLSDEAARAEAEEWFRIKALRRGYDAVTVERVWEVLASFGAFGFCKAHAAAFAIPTYQSSWLKRHYPAAFYAGVLTHDPGMYPKRVIVADARLAGVPILLPDVNASAADWQVERVDPAEGPPVEGPPVEGLRVGLSEIKGISEAEVQRAVAGQPYASLRDFWERAKVSRPVTERLVLVGALDSLYAGPGTQPTRRDLLARVGVLDRSSSRTPASAVPAPLTLDLYGDASDGSSGDASDGFADLVPAGGLRDLALEERVAAELEILGVDVSSHVIGFYEELLAGLNVVRSCDLHHCRAGEQVLVAGVKVATQTPAIRSGKRIIFVTLDDATGPVDLAFFESVQERCAARVFGSWLLLVRGRIRRAGPATSGSSAATASAAVSVNGDECWDLAALEEIRLSGGIGAVRSAMAAGDVPGAGTAPVPDAASWSEEEDAPDEPRKFVYANGFTLSPYAETGSPGAPLKDAPRNLWHASQGSSGDATSALQD